MRGQATSHGWIIGRLGRPLSMGTVGAVAAGLTLTVGASPAAAISAATQVSTWVGPSEFIAAYNAGGTQTIQLTASITENNATPPVLPSGANVTIDLNGFTLTIAPVDGLPNGDAGLGVPAGTSLTIEDTSAGHNGHLNVTGGASTADGGGGAGIGGNGGHDDNGGAGGAVTITGGTVNATGGPDQIYGNGGGAGIGGGGGFFNGAGGGVVSVSGGTVTATGGNSAAGAGAGIGGGGGFQDGGAGGVVSVSGGTVSATGGVGGSGGGYGGGGAGIGGGGGYVGGGGGSIGGGPGSLSVTSPGTVTDSGNGAGTGGGQDALVSAAAATTTTIGSIPKNPVVVGQTITVPFTVTSGSGTPTGTVTIDAGASAASVNCTGVTLVSGAGSCTFSEATAGSYSLTAVYTPADGTFTGSTSTAVTEVVKKGATTTTITSVTPNPRVVGQPFAVHVSVQPKNPAAGVPTGTVTITDDAAGQSCTINSLDASGAGTCTMTETTAGAHKITASYNGDDNFKASTTTDTKQVDKGATTTTITSVTPNPRVVGQPFAVHVIVQPKSPAEGIPTGTVTITDGLVGGQTCTTDSLDAGGAGSCTMTETTATNYTFTASYGGDGNFKSSTNTSVKPVSKGATTTTITASPPLVAGQAVALHVTVVAKSPASGVPTGTVTVSDGTQSCTITLSNGSGSCNLTEPRPGSYTFTATYNGDGNFKSSTNTITKTIKP